MVRGIRENVREFASRKGKGTRDLKSNFLGNLDHCETKASRNAEELSEGSILDIE